MDPQLPTNSATIEPPVIPSQPNVQVPPQIFKKPSKHKVLLIVAIGLLLIFVSLGAFYFLFTKNKPNTSDNPPKYWINCDDIRQVIDDGGVLYAGCLGGVLVVDKNTGEVKDQLSMVNGLGDLTGNSLVKKGDILYVGSQDGVTIFNLKTREAKKVSVKEGLVNGANIELYPDGDNIWVATFDGVSLLNTTSGQITNYTSQLDSAAQKREITNALVTDKYVYFLGASNAYSSGAVIRYDKSSGIFKTFGPDSFGVTGQYAYVNFTTIASYNNQVFVSDDKQMFSIDETPDASWKKIDSPSEFILKDLATDFSSIRILKNTDSGGILIFSGNKIYEYNPVNDTTDVFYDFGKNSPSVIYNSRDGTLWFTVYQDSNWVNSIDLTTKQISNFKLIDRPKSFGSLVALIDDEPVVDTATGIYKYSLDTGKFISLAAFTGNFDAGSLQPVFQPIPGTQNIFIVRQVCGQGCEKPSIGLYNYLDGVFTELALPPEVVSIATTPASSGDVVFYPAIGLSWRDLKNGLLGFSLDGVTDKFIVYNFFTSSWQITTNIPDGANRFDSGSGVVCNNVYTFRARGNSFGNDDCMGTATDGNLSWKISDSKVIEMDSVMGISKTLTPPSLEPNYNPFGSVDKPGFSKILFENGKLWISSNLGLTSYDPVKGTYKLYQLSDGLPSKDIANFLVGKYLWVVTNWGGLSVVPQ